MTISSPLSPRHLVATAREHADTRRGRVRRQALASGVIATALTGALVAPAWQTSADGPTESTPGAHGGTFVVEDALAQFDALKHHGEALAWRNPEDQGAIDPSLDDHYQGLARYPGTGVPSFYVSQSDDDDGGIVAGYVHVVQYGSRPTSGERLGSNLQQIGNDTEEAMPPIADTWVRSIRFDGSLVVDGRDLPAYKHPGGPAIVDDVLFVPVDQPPASGAPTGQIVLFDLRADRLDPVPIQALPLDHGVDNVAVTRRSDDSYLVWTNGESGDAINIYETSTADLRNDDLQLKLLEPWRPSTGLIGSEWPGGNGAHQSSGFVHQPDGSLYLIGTRQPIIGGDYADLYRVDEVVTGTFVLTHLRTREFNCVYDGGGGPIDMRLCHFKAASGTYVSPSGELILYSMPHDDEDGFSIDIARMSEFRHRDMTRENSPLHTVQSDAGGPYAVDEGGSVKLEGYAAAPADRPWIELYDDDGFRDRSIVVEYDTRHLMELSNFNHLDDFNDSTTAVRWRAPVGVDIALYDDDGFRDRYIVLRGTGRTEAITHLKHQPVITGLVEQFNPTKADGVALEFNDKTSSMRFLGDPAPVADPVTTWDLDGDGRFGETGAAALRGDEVGLTPVFDATGLDGPATVQVAMRVTVPGVPAVASDVATIEIRNVAPTVRITPDRAVIAEGDTVLVDVRVTDASPADFVVVSVAWGDGQVDEFDLGTARSATIDHLYVDDDPTGTPRDTVLIGATVRDDDGASGADAHPITIVNVAPVPAVTGLNDGLPFTLVNVPVRLTGSFTDAGVADTHTDPVIHWGDGTSDTVPLDDIASVHVYDTAGTRDVELVITDDDTGTGTATATLEVLAPADATQAVADAIADLLADHPESTSLATALAFLIGAEDGDADSGAVDKIASGDLDAAARRLEQAVASLQAAELDGVDTEVPQHLLTLVARSLATSLYEQVLVELDPPTRGEAKQIASIAADLEAGGTAVAAGDHATAVAAFHRAITTAGDLLPA
jgi:hypothetical protein